MNGRAGLVARRAELLRRSAALRARVAADAQALTPLGAMAERALAGARAVRRRPLSFVAVGLVVGAALLTRPRAAARLAVGAWSGWLFAARLAPLVRLGLRLAQGRSSRGAG